MSRVKPLTTLVALMAFCSGCATWSARTKTIVTMVGVGLASGILGSAVAPPGENPLAHGALWGATAAAVSGASGVLLYDDPTEKEFNRKLELLQKENSILRGEGSGTPSVPLDAGLGLQKELPPEYRHLVRPGQWSIYAIDQWINAGENGLIHQDKMIKIVPAQIAPGAKPKVSAENSQSINQTNEGIQNENKNSL